MINGDWLVVPVVLVYLFTLFYVCIMDFQDWWQLIRLHLVAFQEITLIGGSCYGCKCLEFTQFVKAMLSSKLWRFHYCASIRLQKHEPAFDRVIWAGCLVFLLQLYQNIVSYFFVFYTQFLWILYVAHAGRSGPSWLNTGLGGLCLNWTQTVILVKLQWLYGLHF